MPTWDTAKARANQIKHGVSFLDARDVFSGTHIVAPDRRVDYREQRFLAIGFVEQNCLVVVYTIRHGDPRIISARKASQDEWKKFQPLLEALGKKYSPREGGPHV